MAADLPAMKYGKKKKGILTMPYRLRGRRRSGFCTEGDLWRSVPGQHRLKLAVLFASEAKVDVKYAAELPPKSFAHAAMLDPSQP